jgi:hypothetical protein
LWSVQFARSREFCFAKFSPKKIKFLTTFPLGTPAALPQGIRRLLLSRRAACTGKSRARIFCFLFLFEIYANKGA